MLRHLLASCQRQPRYGCCTGHNLACFLRHEPSRQLHCNPLTSLSCSAVLECKLSSQVANVTAGDTSSVIIKEWSSMESHAIAVSHRSVSRLHDIVNDKAEQRQDQRAHQAVTSALCAGVHLVCAGGPPGLQAGELHSKLHAAKCLIVPQAGCQPPVAVRENTYSCWVYFICCVRAAVMLGLHSTSEKRATTWSMGPRLSQSLQACTQGLQERD